MLNFGGDINYKTDSTVGYVYTPLKAAAGASTRNTKLLVEAGADINYSADNIHSAFSSAVISGSLETVEYLISKGCQYDGPIEIAFDDTIYAIDVLKRRYSTASKKDYELMHQILVFLRENGADSSKK
jgi:hypothetical protein